MDRGDWRVRGEALLVLQSMGLQKNWDARTEATEHTEALEGFGEECHDVTVGFKIIKSKFNLVLIEVEELEWMKL